MSLIHLLAFFIEFFLEQSTCLLNKEAFHSIKLRRLRKQYIQFNLGQVKIRLKETRVLSRHQQICYYHHCRE